MNVFERGFWDFSTSFFRIDEIVNGQIYRNILIFRILFHQIYVIIYAGNFTTNSTKLHIHISFNLLRSDSEIIKVV